MPRGIVVFSLLLLLGMLLSCTSSQAPDEAKTEKTTAPATDTAEQPQPLPPAAAPANPVPPPSVSLSDKAVKTGYAAMPDGSGAASKPAAKNGATGKKEGAEAPPAAANGGANNAWNEPWQKFLANLSTAAYTFNPPSPIKVAKPRTIYLWVDTTVTHQALAEELKKLVPQDANRVKSGTIKVSQVMEATLTGPGEEFLVIKPDSPQRQELNLAGRTTWDWTIIPRQPGTYTLDIKLVVIPPPNIATAPYTRPESLHDTIEVEVTLWWLFDHFFDKYWKWLLGGLGTLLVTILGWWWQRHSGQKS